MSVPIAFVLAILWLYFHNHKILGWFLQKIQATKKFGDEDVWDFVFNSSMEEVEYIHIRDFKKELVYAGWVRAFSETDELRELFLQNVVLYNFKGQELYKVPKIYLARSPEDITIEFPYQREGTDNE